LIGELVGTGLPGSRVASNQHDVSRLLQRQGVPDVLEQNCAGSADLPHKFVVVILNINVLVGLFVIWSKRVEVGLRECWNVLVEEVPSSDDTCRWRSVRKAIM
jgi:hypothetical protein